MAFNSIKLTKAGRKEEKMEVFLGEEIIEEGLDRLLSHSLLSERPLI